jgi:hypothetical protein
MGLIYIFIQLVVSILTILIRSIVEKKKKRVNFNFTVTLLERDLEGFF